MQQISVSLVFQDPGENLPGISRFRNYIAETSNSNRMFEKNIPWESGVCMVHNFM